MIQYILWAISFFFLWVSLFWINHLYTTITSNSKKILQQKPVTIVVPAYNEENTIKKTLDSIRALYYPANKLTILVINDGSTDQTYQICQKYKNTHTEFNLQIINKKNTGKAASINIALSKTTTPYFAVLDADTRITPNSLKELLQTINETKAAAVISVVKVDHPNTIYEKLQHVEYTLSNLFRTLMGGIDTLFLTHGGFCLFNTQILKSVNGFSEKNGQTEDLEIAMRLRSKHYKIVIAKKAVTYTTVPTTFKILWRQRVRWYRGFIYNHIKFKNLLFNRNHGAFGIFQLPINIISVLLLLATLTLVTYGSTENFIEFIYRSATIQGYFINHVLDFPSFTEIILAQNLQITIPIIFSTIIGIYIIYEAFHQFGEKIIPSIFHIGLYFTFIPYLTGMHWMFSIFQEVLQLKRKWR